MARPLLAICPVYAMPAENIRAAQAAADELDKLEGDERHHMMERVQQVLDAAAEQQEAGCRNEAPNRRNHDPPPRRDQGATSRMPTGGVRGRRDKEPAASHSRTHITIEHDQDGSPRAVERRDDCPPPPPLAGRGVFPPRLLITRHSATALAAEESERTMPATGSTASTDPWR